MDFLKELSYPPPIGILKKEGRQWYLFWIYDKELTKVDLKIGDVLDKENIKSKIQGIGFEDFEIYRDGDFAVLSKRPPDNPKLIFFLFSFYERIRELELKSAKLLSSLVKEKRKAQPNENTLPYLLKERDVLFYFTNHLLSLFITESQEVFILKDILSQIKQIYNMQEKIFSPTEVIERLRAILFPFLKRLKPLDFLFKSQEFLVKGKKNFFCFFITAFLIKRTFRLKDGIIYLQTKKIEDEGVFEVWDSSQMPIDWEFKDKNLDFLLSTLKDDSSFVSVLSKKLQIKWKVYL